MDAPVEPADRDRRRAPRDRRRRVRDRRHFWTRLAPVGGLGRAVRWLTGPWSSANGVSWLRLLILFLVIRWGALTVYSIPTPSMEPALHGDVSLFKRDRVAVNKLAFGPRFPFTSQRIVPTGSPKRWDIVVFNSPDPADGGELMIKRVVGLPGEIVKIHLGSLHINDVRVEPPTDIAGGLNYTGGLEATEDDVNRLALNWAKSGRIPVDILQDTSAARMQLQKDLESLGKELKTVEITSLGPIKAAKYAQSIAPEGMALVRKWWEGRIGRHPARYGVTDSIENNIVPQGNYFVLGDNGPESVDSRIFYTVPHENLVGRAFAIVIPVGRAGDLSGFLDTPRGRLVFYGTLVLVALWEIVPGFVAFSWKIRGAIPVLGLARGDHVIVDRLFYGPRIPFTHHRMLWWRRPRHGEAVCFLMSRSKGGFDLYFGEVLSIESGAQWRAIVRGPGDADSRPLVLDARDIVGRVRGIWRPVRRLGRVRAAVQVESPHGDRLD